MTYHRTGQLVLASSVFIGAVGIGILAVFWKTAGLGVIALVFGSLAGGMALLPYEVELSEAGVTTRSIIATCQIEWREARRVLIDKAELGIALVGDQKTLATYGPAYWRRAGNDEMARFFASSVKKHALSIEQSQRALLLDTKNCRVKRRA